MKYCSLGFVAGVALGALVTIGVVSSVRESGSGAGGAEAGRAPSSGGAGDERTGRSSDGGYRDLTPREASAELAHALALATDSEGSMPGELRGLIDKASKFDPQTSFDTAFALGDFDRRREALRRVLGTWVLQDREAAMAAIAGVENLALRRDLLRSAVDSLSRSRPAAAVAVLRTEPSLREGGAWQQAFSNWAKLDPAAAYTALRSLDHPEERRDALQGIAASLVYKDPGAAIAWASELPTGDERSMALHQVLRQAAGSDPILAAEQAALLGQLDERAARDVVGRIAEEWAESDLGAALAWAEELPSAQRDAAFAEIAGDLIHRDPDAAEAMAHDIEDSAGRQKLFGELARLRMAVDAEGAAEWITGLPPEDQGAAWRSAAYEWSRTRPEQAAAFAVTGDVDPATRARLVESAAPQWARTDPVAAADWALAVPGRVGESALELVVGEWSRRDPAAAIGFLGDHVGGERFQQLTRRAVSSWSQEQPAEAAGFAASFESGETKSALYRTVTDRWMRIDSMAASQWVASLEPSAERDSAVTSLIQGIERQDLETAFIWAEEISDGQRKKEMLKRLQRRLEQEG